MSEESHEDQVESADEVAPSADSTGAQPLAVDSASIEADFVEVTGPRRLPTARGRYAKSAAPSATPKSSPFFVHAVGVPPPPKPSAPPGTVRIDSPPAPVGESGANRAGPMQGFTSANATSRA